VLKVSHVSSAVQMMGWVETGSCRRYSPSSGDSALASIPQDTLRTAQPSASCGDAYANFVCAKALKFALQYSRGTDAQQVPPPPFARCCILSVMFLMIPVNTCRSCLHCW
jgi:hypothetical protein